jgi:DNA-binding beta-propeller fold protein YncE
MAAPFGRRRTPRCAVSAAVGCVAVAMALFPAIADAAEPPPSHPFLFALQGEIKEPGTVPLPPPEGELEDACGVAVDSVGDIYVSDYYHRTIDVYRVNGKGVPEYLTQLVDPDPDGPCNLAVDSAGNVYVNNWHRDVVRFTPSEFPPSESTRYGSETMIDFPTAPGARSTGVAIDPATGEIYVDDRTYVAVYEPSGTLTEKIGEGTLVAGYGAAVSDFGVTEGDVYVPDAATNTVKVFGPAGEALAPIDGAGTPQRGFHSLADSNVAVDQSDGHLYVADNTQPGFESPAAVVDEFNAAGDYRGQLPQAMVDAGPTALAVDGGGDVLATSGNTEKAIVYAFGPAFPAHALTVAKTGTGQGTVSSEPAGIECGAACGAEFNAGEEVILTAAPSSGSVFVAWSGCEHPVGARCRLTLGADTEVSAEFQALPPAPLALVAGAGTPDAPGPAPKTSSTASLALARASVSGLTATLQATVPAPGTLTATGPGLSPTELPVSAGPATLRLHLDHRGRLALHKAKRHRLALKATVTFKPNDGAAASVLSKTVTFKTKSQEKR